MTIFSPAQYWRIGVAIVAGPVGCFIIWRRLAYFGDTLSHSALLGVALALPLKMNITLSVFVISVVVSLLCCRRNAARRFVRCAAGSAGPCDTGGWSRGTAFMTWVRVDLMGFPFGDILAVTPTDLAIRRGCDRSRGIGVDLAALVRATVNYDLATAEGARPDVANIVFMVFVAAVIAVSMKLVGVLLIVSDYPCRDGAAVLGIS